MKKTRYRLIEIDNSRVVVLDERTKRGLPTLYSRRDTLFEASLKRGFVPAQKRFAVVLAPAN